MDRALFAKKIYLSDSPLNIYMFGRIGLLCISPVLPMCPPKSHLVQKPRSEMQLSPLGKCPILHMQLSCHDRQSLRLTPCDCMEDWECLGFVWI